MGRDERAIAETMEEDLAQFQGLTNVIKRSIPGRNSVVKGKRKHGSVLQKDSGKLIEAEREVGTENEEKPNPRCADHSKGVTRAQTETRKRSQNSLDGSAAAGLKLARKASGRGHHQKTKLRRLGKPPGIASAGEQNPARRR